MFYSIFPALAIYFLLPVIGRGQNKSATDFYITKKGDTVRGVNITGSKRQPFSITVTENGQKTEFLPQDISGFVNTAWKAEFKSHIIQPMMYNTSIQEALYNERPYRDTARAVFLKILHKGKLNLYLYHDELGKPHFFLETPNSFIEMYIHVYNTKAVYHEIKTIPLSATHHQYSYVLKDAMQNCGGILNLIDQTTLTEKSLIALLKKYDSCAE